MQKLAENGVPCWSSRPAQQNIERKNLVNMATHYNVVTNASRDQLVEAFNATFFQRPGWKNRFTLSRKAQALSNYTWKPASVPGAVAGASIIKGGIAEFAAKSKYGGGANTVLGTTVGLSVEDRGHERVGQLFQAEYARVMFINMTGEVVKAYAQAMCDQLNSMGQSAIASRAG